MRKLLCLLTIFLGTAQAMAAENYITADKQFTLNNLNGSVSRQVQLGSVLKNELVKEAKFTYDFATDGGTVAAVVPLALTDKIPAGSIMLYSVIDVKTAVTDTSAASVGFQCSAFGDIMALTAKGSLTANALIVGTNDWTASNMKRNTSECSVVANIASGTPLTAGKIVGHVFYIVTP